MTMGTNALPSDLQSALGRLFELFGAYVAARSERERAELYEQILDLFSRLGVVSGNPLVKQAAEMIDRISEQRERENRERQLPSLVTQVRSFVNAQLRDYERSQRLVLSGGARQLVRIPIVEAAELTQRFDPEQTGESLSKIFSTLQEEPPTFAEGNSEARTSPAVIRAFWKNFCNIPPFCSGKQ